jgi:hypothetical protein
MGGGAGTRAAIQIAKETVKGTALVSILVETCISLSFADAETNSVYF